MYSQRQPEKQHDFIVSIPGSNEKRLISKVSSHLTFAQVMRRFGDVLRVGNVEDCALSYRYNNEHVILIDSQDDWNNAIKHGFCESYHSISPTPHLTLRKRPPTPSDAQLVNPYNQLSSLLTDMTRSRDEERAARNSLNATYTAQSAELAKLRTANAALASHAAQLKATSTAQAEQLAARNSSSASSSSSSESAQAPTQRELLQALARLDKLEALCQSQAEQLQQLKLAGTSQAPTAAPADPVRPGQPAQQQQQSSETHQANTARANATSQQRNASTSTQPQQPIEAVENLLRSVANLVGGALHTDVTPFFDMALNAATGRTPASQPSTRQPAEPRTAPNSVTAEAAAATAPAQHTASPGTVRRQMTINEIMERSRSMGQSMGAAMGQAQARNAQRAGVDHAQEPVQEQAAQKSAAQTQTTNAEPHVAAASQTPEAVSAPVAVATGSASNTSEGGYEMVEDEKETSVSEKKDTASDVEATNNTLSSAFDDMLAKMRETRTDSYKPYVSKAKGKASAAPAQAQPQQPAPQQQQSSNNKPESILSARINEHLSNAFEEMLKRANGIQ